MHPIRFMVWVFVGYFALLAVYMAAGALQGFAADYINQTALPASFRGLGPDPVIAPDGTVTMYAGSDLIDSQNLRKRRANHGTIMAQLTR